MNRIFISLVFFLTLCVFSASGQFSFLGAVGNYQYIHNNYDSAFLVLRSDSSFDYYWKWHSLNGLTTGTWALMKDCVILNSETQPIIESTRFKDQFIVDAFYDSLSPKTIIQLKDVNDAPIPSVECWVGYHGNILRDTSDLNGKLSFNYYPVNSISANATFAQQGFITLKNKHKDNVFIIKLLQVNKQYLYLTNERLRLVNQNDHVYLHETFVDPHATFIFKKE